MNQQFILFRRAGVFYCEDTRSGKLCELGTLSLSPVWFSKLNAIDEAKHS